MLICVDCEPPEWLRELPRVCAQTMTAAQNYGASESTSVEHGSFLSLLPGDDDDLFIKADGDMVMQRPFDEEEMTWLCHFPPGALAAAWNAGPGDNLGAEARRLSPKVDGLELARRFPLYETIPCGNGGTWIARRASYRAMYAQYIKHWKTACDSFYHYARQQWLINYSRYAAGLEWLELSPVIHAHAHYGLPAGVSVNGDGAAYHNGKPVVFRHKL